MRSGVVGLLVVALPAATIAWAGCTAYGGAAAEREPSDAPTVYVDPPVGGDYERGLLDLSEIVAEDPTADDALAAAPALGTVPAAVELPAAADRAAGLAALRRGMSFAATGDAAAAGVEFERAAVSLPPFAGWAELLAARAYAAAGQVDEVRRRLARIAGTPAYE